jgi:hypothetical protein
VAFSGAEDGPDDRLGKRRFKRARVIPGQEAGWRGPERCHRVEVGKMGFDRV